MATGVGRLDELLGGGIPSGNATLIYGPPFTGKDVLSRVYTLTGLEDSIPSIMVLTDDTAMDVRAALASADADFEEHESSGLAHFVDTYSKSIGAEEGHKFTEYVDGPINLNAISVAVNNAQRRIIQDHPHHRLVFNSISTLIAYTNAQTTFRFLQVFIGKAKRAGATSFFHLEEGMHTEAEVQMVKHLVDGVIRFRTDEGKHLLKVEGNGVTQDRGWVEYVYTEDAFEITGSFAAGRIR